MFLIVYKAFGFWSTQEENISIWFRTNRWWIFTYRSDCATGQRNTDNHQ